MKIKSKNKIILISILVVLIFGLFFLNKFYVERNNEEIKISEIEKKVKTNEINTPKIKQNNTEITRDNSKEQLEMPVSNYATINVLGKSFQINISNGDSVYQAMNNLTKEDNNFSFKTKEYPSLGIFVNEINGVSSIAGNYWIYYVNKKEASVGVSKYILKSGDVIDWKQE